MSDAKLSIVIPAYNESARIEQTLERVTWCVEEQDWDAEILVVDDGSQDATSQIVERWMERYPRLKLIKNNGNRGKGYSVRNGLLQAAGEVVMFTDADLSAPMEEAERLCDRVAIVDHGRVIALGTPKELIAMVGGDDIVEFAVSASDQTIQKDADAVAEALKAIPGVQSHRVHEALHQLSVSELHTAVPRIFAALEEQGLHLSEFRTHSATLEDVFVRLTGRNLRDE